MCGIVGFSWDDKNLIKHMADEIEHRGPDDSGFLTDSNVSLGHRRLSIIDLSEKGKNPMWNENKDVCIIFNGEIFNYIELRAMLEKRGHKFFSDTDTETIVHLYEDYGEECVSHLWGFFAFAIYDIKKGKLLLARDRIGKKPLYYYLDNRQNKKRLIFASELKAILAHKDIEREISPQALNNYLALRYSATEETILKGIYRLKPGHTMLYNLKTGKANIKRYWRINNSDSNIKKISENEAKETIYNLLEDSVKRRMISDVPLGAYLSGGLDSSSVVGIMAKLSPDESVKTFSVGFDGDKVGNELGYARDIAKLFATDHKEILIKSRQCMKELPNIVWHLDEPLSDPAVVPNYIMSREAKKKVTVILTGDGADEIFAGYDQYKFLKLGNKFKWLPRFVRKDVARSMVKILPYSILNKIYPYSSSTGNEMFERFGNFFSEVDENKAKAYLEIVSIFNEKEREELLLLRKNLKKLDLSQDLNKEYFKNKNNFLNNVIKLDMETYLPEDLLMKPDKMCMAFQIEARVPFLDHRLIEYSFNLPPEMKMRGTTTKYILKQAMKKVLPKHIIERKKQPFVVPLDVWIEKDLKGTFNDIVNQGSIIKRGLVEKRAVRKIFDNYSHSKMYYGRQMWSLVNLELWHKIFMENSDPGRMKL